jgi:hypothetical protein
MAIETNGMAAVLLDHCYRLLEIQSERFPSINPIEARAAVESQVSSIRDRMNDQFVMLGSVDDQIEESLAIKVNVTVFQTYQVSRQIDQLIGGGATEEFVLSVAEAYGDLVTRAIARVEDVFGSAANAAQNILGSAGFVGWTVYVLAGLLALGVYFSLKKGVVPK